MDGNEQAPVAGAVLNEARERYRLCPDCSAVLVSPRPEQRGKTRWWCPYCEKHIWIGSSHPPRVTP
jgi:uncharacterized protein with PIN domain